MLRPHHLSLTKTRSSQGHVRFLLSRASAPSIPPSTAPARRFLRLHPTWHHPCPGLSSPYTESKFSLPVSCFMHNKALLPSADMQMRLQNQTAPRMV